jgi:hypothetical protein
MGILNHNPVMRHGPGAADLRLQGFGKKKTRDKKETTETRRNEIDR